MADAPAGVLRLLLVEDHEDIGELLVLMVYSLGHHARRVTTVAGALEAIAAESFDLVITDYGLPDGTGVDLLQRLGHPRPAVILLSAFPRAAMMPHLKTGFAQVLEKPVDLDGLARSIDAVRPRRGADAER